MMSVEEFYEQDQDRWDKLFAIDDYNADIQLQQEYDNYCHKPRLNLQFVCNCVSPSEDIGGYNGLIKIIETMEEIDEEGIEGQSLREEWGDEIGSYGTSLNKVSLNNKDYIVFVHSAIEHIYIAS